MTRENKLALIVGFGLVLFMGILVSDHLSTARRQAAASFDLGTGPSLQPIATGNGWLVYGAETPGQPPADGSGSTLEPIPVAGSNEHSPHYVVAPGDSLQLICQRHYGDASLADALAAYNRLPNPDRLTTRTRLLLPTVDDLLSLEDQLEPHTTAVAFVDVSPAATTPEPAAPTFATVGQYTVQPGDTLSELAQQLLGSARETDRLYEYNRDVLRHRDDLRVGATLRYPLSPE